MVGANDVEAVEVDMADAGRGLGGMIWLVAIRLSYGKRACGRTGKM
jgi:hypothetical protein